MGKTIKYSVRINTNSFKQGESITNITRQTPEYLKKYSWVLSFIEEENNTYVDPIIYFENVFSNLDKLKQIGVERNNISIWIEVWYNGECNMEFSAKQLLEFSKLGTSLCITCTELD